MPAVPYIDPNRVPPAAEGGLPLVFAPFFALLGVLGLAAVSYELPSFLLLFPAEELPTLALLRAYWTGRMTFSVLALLSPLLFLGLTFLMYQLTARKLDLEIRKQNRLAPFILMPFLLPLTGILMWAALAPGGTFAFCDEIAADIQQIEGGNLESMTVLLDEKSTPDTTFRDNPEGWQVFDRRAVGTDGRGLALRFPETLDPEAVGPGAWYQIFYTSNFHLVVEITPVGGEEP